MKRFLQIALPVVFTVLGVLMFVAVNRLSATPDKVLEEAPPMAVEAVTLFPETQTSRIQASGTVQASTRIDVVPQVAGKVVATAPGLTPGLRLSKGDVLARLDDRDYVANVTQAEANVAAARLDLELEQGRGTQAAREWELLGQAPSGDLALRKPQLAAAKARLAAAEAALTTARANLERTRLVAPWDAIVLSESLDVGQYVAPGAPVAALMGTDRFRVRLAVPVRNLPFVHVPTEEGAHGSEVVLHQNLGDGGTLETRGFVLRMLGELDAETRTAGVLVAVDDPLDVAEGTLPILPGAYVDADILGREIEGVYRVPRVAVVEGTKVWIADAENRLATRDITVAWGDPKAVYVTDGLQPGDRVITTPLSLPVVGMALDVRQSVAEAR